MKLKILWPVRSHYLFGAWIIWICNMRKKLFKSRGEKRITDDIFKDCRRIEGRTKESERGENKRATLELRNRTSAVFEGASVKSASNESGIFQDCCFTGECSIYLDDLLAVRFQSEHIPNQRSSSTSRNNPEGDGYGREF